MTQKSLNISYFFNNQIHFPWDALDIPRPNYGPIHLYLCYAACTFVSPELANFLRGMPTMTQLKNNLDGANYVVKSIYEYASLTNDSQCRFQKERYVIMWLSHQETFCHHMKEVLDRKYRQGLVLLPVEAFISK